MRSSWGYYLVLLSLSAGSAGCELVAKVDRDKIPGPQLMRPDASPPVASDEDAGADGGPSDAGKLDAAAPDTGTPDGGARASDSGVP